MKNPDHSRRFGVGFALVFFLALILNAIAYQ
jgi:hypothetical protein